MGDAQNQPLQLSFNPRLRIEFQGSWVTSDGGLILVRELDERLGVSDLIAQHITDPRGKNTQFPLTDLVRQSVYRRLAGYEDVNDAERLCHDPTFRLIGSEQIWERGTAPTSRVHSFETELLTQGENLAGYWRWEWCPRNRLPMQSCRMLRVPGGHKQALDGFRSGPRTEKPGWPSLMGGTRASKRKFPLNHRRKSRLTYGR